MAVKAKAEITISKIIDIDKVVRYYLLQSSTLAAPSKPADGATIGSNWSKTEPSYTSGSTSTLYFVDQTVMSNGALKYSEVSKSSSYEAAKEAWNKAKNAQDTANSANNKIDRLQVGGRNLLIDSGFNNGYQSLIDDTYQINNNHTVKLYVNNTATSGNQYCGISDNYDNKRLSVPIADCLNKDLTLSAWLYIPEAGSVSGYEFRVVYTDNGTTMWYTPNRNYPMNVPSISNLSVGWNHLYATFTISGDSTVLHASIDVFAAPGKTSLAYLSSPKLEFGTRPTDWTPAPEDALNTVDVEYYLSTSATSLAGGSWSTTAPTWVNGKYMWSRTVKTDGAGNKTYSPSQNGVCIAGAKGDTGAKGDKGDTGGTGPTGKGVKSIVEQYYKSTSATSLAGGSWSGTYPGWENGKYIWTRSVITYTDNTTTTTTAVCVTGQKGDTGAKGDKGETGETGPTGKGIKSTAVTYQIGSSGTTVPTGTWNTSVPSVAAGQYLWTRTIITYTDNTTSTSYSVGRNGTNGSNGKDGKGIKSSTITYQLSASRTTAPTGTWVGSPPAIDAAKPYLWTRTIVTYTDNTTSSPAYSVSTPYDLNPVLTDISDLKTRVTDAETSITNNATQIETKASQTEVTTLADNLNVYIDKNTTMIQDINGWQYNWDKLIRTTEADVANHRDYITFKNGDIILGESASELKLKITNDSIQFKGTDDTEATPDPDATAWITGQKFNINEGEIHNSLKVGRLQFMPRPNGNFAISIT